MFKIHKRKRKQNNAIFGGSTFYHDTVLTANRPKETTVEQKFA